MKICVRRTAVGFVIRRGRAGETKDMQHIHRKGRQKHEGPWWLHQDRNKAASRVLRKQGALGHGV